MTCTRGATIAWEMCPSARVKCCPEGLALPFVPDFIGSRRKTQGRRKRQGRAGHAESADLDHRGPHALSLVNPLTNFLVLLLFHAGGRGQGPDHGLLSKGEDPS